MSLDLLVILCDPFVDEPRQLRMLLEDMPLDVSVEVAVVELAPLQVSVSAFFGDSESLFFCQTILLSFCFESLEDEFLSKD